MAAETDEEASQPERGIRAAPVRAALTASAVEVIDVDECWELLAREHIGRLALIRTDATPDIFPTDYLVHERQIFLRSAPGSKLFQLARNPRVAYEVEGFDDGFMWSVVVHGLARRLAADDEIEDAGIHEFATSIPTSKDNFLRITASDITGRRFRPQR